MVRENEVMLRLSDAAGTRLIECMNVMTVSGGIQVVIALPEQNEFNNARYLNRFFPARAFLEARWWRTVA